MIAGFWRVCIQTIETVDKDLEKYDFTHSARNLEDFINELSTWYLRRSRKRFSSSDEKDKESAFQTTHEVLVKTSMMIAPFAPFIAEELYQRLAAQFVDSGADLGFAESVHLADFPQADKKMADHNVLDAMTLARKIVEMAHSLRASAKIKVRQPLQTLYVHGKFSSDEGYVEELEDLIKDEVNVKELVAESDGKTSIPKGFVSAEAGGYTVALDIEITPELRDEGLLREIIRMIQESRKKAGCSPEEKVGLLFESKELAKLILKNADKLRAETNLEYVEEGISKAVDFSGDFEIEGKAVKIGIEKF